jgi:dihydrofolate synthase/folylpolyglutamate synthase
MNYKETIDYLFSRLPMFSKTGADAFKKDLTNTLALCKALGDPHKKIKTIHVAGTNGKGSVSHMLAAILQTAGYKTGLYTSPHLRDFRERIKLNGCLVPEEFVVSFTQQCMPLIEEIEPSFFEITVAMAFDYFAKQEVDIAVIETGLGGRLDSTNVIHPVLSVITNIGWDHMNMLGNTLTEIASEKAGIIKKNVPVVIGEVLPETSPVFTAKASEQHADVHYANQQYQIAHAEATADFLNLTVTSQSDRTNKNYQLDLNGWYQQKNLLTVLTACDVLKESGWSIEEQHLQNALRNSRKLNGLMGRWEIIQSKPTVVLDVGHNVDGIRQILEQLERTAFRHLHIVFGMVKDKDLTAVLELLPPQATYYFTKAQIPRALPEQSLQKEASQFALSGMAYQEVNEALLSALKDASADDLILVCGSVFLVGEVDVASISKKKDN